MSAASPRLRFQRELFAVVRESRVTQQQQLLHRCVERHLDLSAELRKAGLGYGDLRYCFDVAGCADEENPRLDHFRRKPHGIGVVSFFAGCGGLDLGFEAAGFRHEASIEINKLFCTTLKKNRPKWRVIGPPECTGDVSKEGEIEKHLRRIAGVRKPYDGVFIGGPPCQPFSIAANQRFSKNGKNFKRIGYAHETQGNLLHHYVSLIRKFSPAAFLIENVTGLLDIDGGKQLREVLGLLRRSGYSIEEPMQLNAADYHVPQQRTRLFIVGTRLHRAFHPPKRAPRVFGCGSALEEIPADCANHEPREHKAESVLRYMGQISENVITLGESTD